MRLLQPRNSPIEEAVPTTATETIVIRPGSPFVAVVAVFALVLAAFFGGWVWKLEEKVGAFSERIDSQQREIRAQQNRCDQLEDLTRDMRMKRLELKHKAEVTPN